MRQIFQSGEMPAKIDEEVVKKTADKLMKGVEEGYGKKLINIDYNTPDYEMEASLQSDVWQFSGAKNYQQMKSMTEALVNPKGTLRSFADFKRAVRPIIEDHTQWLQTEYRTAVASSQMAAKWVRILKDKKALPYLQFEAIEDDRTTKLCRTLDGVIKRVDDPFWEVYYPPNHFNCRSDVRQLSSGKETPDEEVNPPDIPTMFRTNVAQQGLIYPPGSSYYNGLPKKVKRQSEDILGNTVLKQAKRKFEKANRIIKRPELKKNITISNKSMKELKQHNIKENNGMKNILIYDIDEVLKSADYLGKKKPNPKNEKNIEWTHLFSTTIKEQEVLLLVQEDKAGNNLFPYAFSENMSLKKQIK